MIKRGFTIIELLIAVALTVVIGMMVSLAFTNTQKASQRVTSAMRLQLKGRAVMDLVARDLANMAISNVTGSKTTPEHTDSVFDVDDSGAKDITGIAFKTHLPVQNTHYSNGFTAEDGYYAQDIVDVRWEYDDNADKKKLYRKVTAPTGTTGSADTVIKGTKFSAGDDSTTGDGDTVDPENLVTSGDLRKFKFDYVYIDTNASGTCDSGETIHGYTIDFSLTDAPLSETDVVDKKTAEENGYVWLDFHRSVMVPRFNKP